MRFAAASAAAFRAACMPMLVAHLVALAHTRKCAPHVRLAHIQIANDLLRIVPCVIKARDAAKGEEATTEARTLLVISA